jgi:hypothetical protein
MRLFVGKGLKGPEVYMDGDGTVFVKGEPEDLRGLEESSVVEHVIRGAREVVEREYGSELQDNAQPQTTTPGIILRELEVYREAIEELLRFYPDLEPLYSELVKNAKMKRELRELKAEKEV